MRDSDLLKAFFKTGTKRIRPYRQLFQFLEKTVASSVVQMSGHSMMSYQKENRTKSAPEIDFRPDYMKHSISSEKKLPVKTILKTEDAATEILNVSSRVSLAFDHLAATISRTLVYPDELVEHNVQGTATLDLKFDRKGNIDELESRFTVTGREFLYHLQC